MNKNYFENNPTLEYVKITAPFLKQISKPLFSGTPIKHIEYVRLSKSGHLTNLSTDSDWVKYRFENNIKYVIIPESKDIQFTKYNEPELYFISENYCESVFKKKLHFGNAFGGAIRLLNEKSLDIFFFVTNEPNQNNFFLHNFDLLKTFIIYFKKSLNDFDAQLTNEATSFLTDLNFDHYKEYLKQCIFESEVMKNNFKNNLKCIPLCDENISLTVKEIQCCYYLLKGYPFKSIANKLEISPRTIEHRVNTIKNKMDLVSRSSIISYLDQYKWMIDSIVE